MGTSMQQVFALEIDLRAAAMLGQATSEIQLRGATCKFRQMRLEFLLKFGIVLGLQILALQILQRSHQRLGHINTAVFTKVTSAIRLRKTVHGCDGCIGSRRHVSLSLVSVVIRATPFLLSPLLWIAFKSHPDQQFPNDIAW